MELHEYFFLHHTLIACAMFSYNLDDPETKRIKVQSHSKKTVSFFIISSTCGWPRNQSSVSSWFFFSWQPTLDDKAACVSFSLCWLCCDFLFLTATQKTLAWDSASYSNQWTSEASFPGTFYYWNVKKQDTCTCTIAVMEISTEWCNPWNCMRYFYQPGQDACWFCLLYACNLCAIQNS